MNKLRFLLGVLALLIVCGVSRGSEWQRLPLGPANPEADFENAAQESGNLRVTTIAPYPHSMSQADTGWRQASRSNDAARNKNMPGAQNDQRPNFPRLKTLFGRFRGQGQQ